MVLGGVLATDFLHTPARLHGYTKYEQRVGTKSICILEQQAYSSKLGTLSRRMQSKIYHMKGSAWLKLSTHDFPFFKVTGGCISVSKAKHFRIDLIGYKLKKIS